MYIYKRTLAAPATCTFHCGPRSFLVNLNGDLVCQRDISTRYWGSVTDVPSIPVASYCRPDVFSCS